MKIVTKKGDRGQTRLFLGGEMAKDSPVMEMVGTLDELCSFLGMAKSLMSKKAAKKDLESVQEDLFVVGAEVATAAKFIKKLKRRIIAKDVRRLEERIQVLESRRTLEECCFCLPGKNLSSGVLDVARCVARRCERNAVSLSRRKLIRNPQILIYLNRLSDLLYLLARAAEKDET